MVNFDLNNRVAVVTGGAQGFGFSITERFLDSGAKVIVWDVDKKAIEEASKKNIFRKMLLSISGCN